MRPEALSLEECDFDELSLLLPAFPYEQTVVNILCLADISDFIAPQRLDSRCERSGG